MMRLDCALDYVLKGKDAILLVTKYDLGLGQLLVKRMLLWFSGDQKALDFLAKRILKVELHELPMFIM